MNNQNPLDKLHEELFDCLPSRDGEALEKLSLIALSIIQPGNPQWDLSVRGLFSKQVYQVDGVLSTKSNDKIVECKDYFERGKSVGRPDIQQFQGALIDQPYSKGIFVSSTGYTRNAYKYEVGLVSNPRATPIDLYEIRNSTEKDEDNRIKTIIITYDVAWLDFSGASFEPKFTESGYQALIESGLKEGDRISQTEDKFYDSTGNVLKTVYDISLELNKYVNHGMTEINCCHRMPNGHMKVNGILAEIHGLIIKVPIKNKKDEIRIESSDSRLIVKSLSGDIDKLLSFEDLKTQYMKIGGQLISQRQKMG